MADADALTRTNGTSLRKVYFTLEGERELTTNDLQKLARRHCVVTKTALAAVEIETSPLPDRWYSYRSRNVPALILRRQAERVGAVAPETYVEPSEVDPIPHAADDEIPADDPFAF